MGRFYKTANSQFVDYMFKPNVKLNLALAQQEIQNNYLKSKLLQYAPDVEVQHLGLDNERVKELQNTYDTAITDLTQKMYDNPDNSQKYIMELNKLQKDMLQDKTSGDWYNIEQRATGVQNWLKENEDKKSSMPGVYSALQSHWLNKLAEDVKNNPAAKFEGQRVVSMPTLSKEQLIALSKMPASSSERLVGNYDVTTSGVSRDRVENTAWGELANNPDMQAYIYQMGHILKQPGYYNEDGTIMNPFELRNINGEIVSSKEFESMSDEQKQGISRHLNQNSAFAPRLQALGVANSYQNMSYSPNKFALQEKLKDARTLASGKSKNTSSLDSDIANSALVLRLPRNVVPFDTINDSFDNWFALNSKKAAGKDYDATKLLQLDAMIDPFVTDHGKFILKSYGDNIKNFTKFQDKKAEVVRILKEINKADANPNYETTLQTVNGYYATTSTLVPTTERTNLEKTKKAIQNKWGDYKNFLSKNMTLAVNFKTIGGDETSKKVLDIINAHGIFETPNVRTRNTAVFDLNGKRTEATSIKFDANGDGSGTTDNPARTMVKITGKSISEMIADNYLAIAYRPTGKNKLTAVFAPTQKFRDEFATMKDAKISGNDISTFSETFSGVSNLLDIFPESDSPDENELHLRAKHGKQYILASDKIYYQEGLQKKNPKIYDIYSKGYTIHMPYFNKNVLVGYQLDNKGGITLRGINTKSKKTFEEYISAGSIQRSGLDRISVLKMFISSQLSNLEEFKNINKDDKK